MHPADAAADSAVARDLQRARARTHHRMGTGRDDRNSRTAGRPAAGAAALRHSRGGGDWPNRHPAQLTAQRHQAATDVGSGSRRAVYGYKFKLYFNFKLDAGEETLWHRSFMTRTLIFRW